MIDFNENLVIQEAEDWNDEILMKSKNRRFFYEFRGVYHLRVLAKRSAFAYELSTVI